MTQNITMHSDDELVDIFLNDEGLYDRARYYSKSQLVDLADELFEYNTDQLNAFETFIDEEGF